MPELVGGAPVLGDLLPLARGIGELVPLAHDDDGEVLPALVPALDVPAGLLDRDRLLRDQDDVGAAGDAAHDRDPARVPAHHLDDHDAVVGLRGRVQPVDRLGGDGEGRVEAERVVGRGEVVVDRLRHADDRERMLLEEPRGDAERVLAADGDEAVEPLRLDVLEDALDAVLELVRVRARGAENRAPRGRIPEIARLSSGSELALDEPAPALAHADHLVPAVERPPRHRADDRVQTRAIPSSGEECNALAHS